MIHYQQQQALVSGGNSCRTRVIATMMPQLSVTWRIGWPHCAGDCDGKELVCRWWWRVS